MNTIYVSESIYVSDSNVDHRGRGVFAKVDIKKGEVIEKCPFVEIPENNLELLENSALAHYIFFYGKKKEKILLALGFGSIYNHSYSPNAKYIIKAKEKLLMIVAIKDIKEDSEITFNYKGNSKSKNPLWFEGK